MGYPFPPNLKIKSFLNWKPNPSPLKSKPGFQEMIPRRKTQKSDTVINTGVSLKKQHWKKVTEISQKHNFLTWSIQNFVRRKK